MLGVGLAEALEPFPVSAKGFRETLMSPFGVGGAVWGIEGCGLA